MSEPHVEAQRLWIPVTDFEWLLQNHRNHPQKRAQKVKALRTKAGWMAKAELLPMGPPVAVFARAYVRGGTLPDADAIAPMVKAVLDGIVDAQIIPDDSGQYVHFLGYGKPERDRSLKNPRRTLLVALTANYQPF